MAIPVQLEIFMKDLTKAGLQSVGKKVRMWMMWKIRLCN